MDRRIQRGIKDAPRRGAAGSGVENGTWESASALILPHPAPPVKPLADHLRRLVDQAAARAARDLAGAERARQAGDRDRYLALRRRALKHQILYCSLREGEKDDRLLT